MHWDTGSPSALPKCGSYQSTVGRLLALRDMVVEVPVECCFRVTIRGIAVVEAAEGQSPVHDCNMAVGK